MLPGIPSIQQELSHGRDVAFGMMTKQTSVNCDQSELEKSILTVDHGSGLKIEESGARPTTLGHPDQLQTRKIEGIHNFLTATKFNGIRRPCGKPGKFPL